MPNSVVENSSNQFGSFSGRRRWLICALLFFAATVNYMDRQVIALLKPTLQVQFGWTDVDYSNIVLIFQFAYGVGVLFVGKLIDRIGTRKGFSLAVFVWSVAAIAHAAAASIFQFAAARFFLGLGEAGSFPASVKAVAEWFPKKQRALATGLFNSGANVGAIVTPFAVQWLTYRFGWRTAFIATGSLGVLWIAAWVMFYQLPEKSSISAAELAYIRSDPDDEATPIPLRTLLTLNQAWAVASGKFFTDPFWYVYLFWIPDFLSRKFNMDLRGMALPLFIIYTGASIGSITGGWLSSFLLSGGVVSKCQPQDCPPRLRAGRYTDYAGGEHSECVARGVADRACRWSASRLVGKHLHARFRHVSPERSSIGRRLRHHGGDDCRNAYRQGRGLHSAERRILRAGVRARRVGLSCRPRFRSGARTSAQAGANLMRSRSPSGDERVAGASDLPACF